MTWATTGWGEKRRASANAENAFMQQVITLAITMGWQHYHVYNASMSRKGFPDLVLFRERVIFAELKARSRLTNRMGKMSAEQYQWRDTIQAAGAEWYMWTDEDMQEIAEVLQKPGQNPRVV